MRNIVQARLDEDSKKSLERLASRLGWTSSQVVRESIRLMEACYGRGEGRRIAGVGKISSGVRDLGSNKRHLAGLGR